MGFNSYEFRLLRAKRHADKVKQDQIVKEIWHRNDASSDDRTKVQFSKILVAFIFIDCLIIQAFIMVMLWTMKDTSQLGNLVGLIGTLFVQGASLYSYNFKSAKENSKDGIVYETAMREMMMQQNASTPSNNVMAIDDDEDAVG